MDYRGATSSRRHWIFHGGILFSLVSLLLVTQSISAQQSALDGFQARTYRNARGEAMPYRLFIPRGYDKKKKYPLVLWLHGAVGRGKDNRRQITGGNKLGTHVWTTPENQAEHPAFVLAPQCPEHHFWRKEELRVALEIVAATQTVFSIDSKRLYVAGQSMGGAGTWRAITRFPTLFAAAVPLCGPGDPDIAGKIAKLPIWIFHGAEDQSVPVAVSRRMVAALRAAGGRPRYTEYENVGHDVWERAFAEPELLTWLFAQERK